MLKPILCIRSNTIAKYIWLNLWAVLKLWPEDVSEIDSPRKRKKKVNNGWKVQEERIKMYLHHSSFINNNLDGAVWSISMAEPKNTSLKIMWNAGVLKWFPADYCNIYSKLK